MCLCGAKWGVSPGIRGGFAGRYAAVGRILKRAGWVAGFDRCLECLCSAILLDEVLDGLSLVSVDPAAERGEQEPQGEVVDHLAESSVVKWPM